MIVTKIAVVALFALVTSAAQASTIWDVEYFIRGDVSQTTHFYGAGAYEFLLTPNYTTVYLNEPGTIYRTDGTTYIGLTWVFIGMYGAPALGYPAAVLPEGFPLIAFPQGYDQAAVVPIVQLDTGPSAVVPEPPTWLLMLAGMAVFIAARYRQLEGLGWLLNRKAV